jgi:hypothetical protein
MNVSLLLFTMGENFVPFYSELITFAFSLIISEIVLCLVLVLHAKVVCPLDVPQPQLSSRLQRQVT